MSGADGIMKGVMGIRFSLCIAFAVMLSSCGSDSEPTSPTPVSACTDAVITIGAFSNGSPVSPGQGLLWTSYFGANILPAQPLVYVVDINFGGAGCGSTWTAVSADTSAVQLSPASGVGKSQVELFMPANPGAQRTTLITIAGKTALITQRGQ